MWALNWISGRVSGWAPVQAVLLVSALAGGMASGAAVAAQDGSHAHGHATPVSQPIAQSAAQSTAAEAQWVDGTVRKVDAAARKLTLQHGPLPRLGMPPMTMQFAVADGIALDTLQAGAQVRFDADAVDGALTVMRLEAVH